MIALAISALLGLYILLPDFLFDRYAYEYVRLKKQARSTPEEIFSGFTVAIIPFFLAFAASHYSWFVGHYPFFVDEAVALKERDYELVFSAMFSDAFFSNNRDAFWEALSHVWRHQLRFAVWFYVFLFAIIRTVNDLSRKYGDWRANKFYQFIFGKNFSRRISEWHALLTTLTFPTTEHRRVEVDLMTTDSVLYRGFIADYFLDKDGELTGILLEQAKRFKFQHLEADRKAGKKVSTEDYWKVIRDGSHFYIPATNIGNLNIRYELSDEKLVLTLSEFIESLGLQGVSVTVRPAPATTKLSTSGPVVVSGSADTPPEIPRA